MNVDEVKLFARLQKLSNQEKEEYLKLLELKDKEKCETSFYYFLKTAWKIIEPTSTFKTNWHIKSICDHLEAVTRGDIHRLIINVPYRSSKSTIVSVLWPVWCWLQDPTKRFLTGSHAEKLAIRDSVRSRRVMDHPWFKHRWGNLFKLTGDQNEKKRYENNKTGVRVSFGVTSGVTGEGGDIIILDDPHNAKKAMFSDQERQNTLDSWDQEISTRLNDPETSAVVIIMQRLHVTDLTGHLLKQGSWEHLRFPMLFETTDPCVTSLGAQDPRTKEKQLMWPARFSQKWVDCEQVTLGMYGFAAQLQQRPAPRSGGIVNIDWFKRFKFLPSHKETVQIVQFWDTAQKAKELLNCPWVCGTWLQTETGLYLIDTLRKWMTYPEGKKTVVDMAMKYNPNAIVIEDKSTGSSLLQELNFEGTLPLIPFQPEGDKITRLSTETPIIEAGCVYIPETANWLFDFEEEITNFPNAATMDQADMLSMALKYFRTSSVKADLASLYEYYESIPEYGAANNSI